MLLRKAYVFKLKPDGATRRKFARFCGCDRFVYNKALAWTEKNHERDKSFRFSCYGLCDFLPGWKEELPWHRECSAQILQQSMKDLYGGFERSWKGLANHPKRHKKWKDRDSIRFPQNFKLDEAGRLVYLPKTGWVKYRRSRFNEGTAKNVTVSRAADGWYFSIQTEREVEDSVHPREGTEAGIDVGVVHLVTLSDGTVIEPINAFRRNQEKLASLQRKLKRMKKFGKNWRKLQQKIARLCKHTADSRRDQLRKAAREISKNHAFIYREALEILNIIRSASGTVEEPGKNVKQKSGHNKAIRDQGWGMFFTMPGQYMRE